MKSDMSKIPIREYLDLYGDGIHGTPEYADDGEYYSINGNNIKDGKINIDDNTLKVSRSEYEKIKRPLSYNSLLMSINGTLGNIGVYNGEKIALGKSACFLNVKEDCNKYFVKYLLSTKEFQKYIMLVAHGSTIKNLAPRQIADYVPELPDDIDVDRVAMLLKSIDDKIESNKQIVNTLEKMAKTLYDYWFVQFDFPDDNGHPYKTSGGKMEWNETLSREIPIGWEVVQLKKFAEVIQGNSPAGNTLNLEKNGIAFYQGKTDFGMRFPIERIYTTEPYRYAEPMDTLLSVRAPVGSVNMSEDKCCIGRGLAAIHQEKYPSLVYYMMMRLQPLFEKRGGGGTTFDSITKDDIKDALICRPPKLICELFEKQVSVIDRQILNLTQSARKLSSLRDFLLPVLMNGQVGFLNEREDL